MEKQMNLKLWHGGTNECKAIARRNKWMSTYSLYNTEKQMGVNV